MQLQMSQQSKQLDEFLKLLSQKKNWHMSLTAITQRAAISHNLKSKARDDIIILSFHN